MSSQKRKREESTPEAEVAPGTETQVVAADEQPTEMKVDAPEKKKRGKGKDKVPHEEEEEEEHDEGYSDEDEDDEDDHSDDDEESELEVVALKKSTKRRKTGEKALVATKIGKYVTKFKVRAAGAAAVIEDYIGANLVAFDTDEKTPYDGIRRAVHDQDVVINKTYVDVNFANASKEKRQLIVRRITHLVRGVLATAIQTTLNLHKMTLQNTILIPVLDMAFAQLNGSDVKIPQPPTVVYKSKGKKKKSKSASESSKDEEVVADAAAAAPSADGATEVAPASTA
jgi:hypothetical protein